MTKFSVQLLTFHRTDTIRPLFESLNAQTATGWTLYWIDSGSTPEEYAEMERIVADLQPRFPIVRIKHQTNINFSAGHQSLYESTDAEYVALVNDDAILAPEYFAALIAALDARPDLASVSGVVLRWNFSPSREVIKTDVIDTVGLKRSPWQAISDVDAGKLLVADAWPNERIAEVFGVSGCLPMYRRSAVGAQLFDPTYVYYKEDTDVAYRLHNAGFKAGTVARARAWHMRGLKPSLFHRGVPYRKLFYSYRNHLWNLRKHLSARDWVRYGVAIVAYELAKAAFLLLTHPTILWRVLTKNPA